MEDPESNTLLNALVGAVATIVLSFTIVSPILGGAAAGYLETRDGVRVGAISGVVASLPLLLFGLLLVGIAPAVGAGGPRIGLLVAFSLFVVGVVYIVSLSALGGYLGVYLRTQL